MTTENLLLKTKNLHFAAFDVNDKENYAHDKAYTSNDDVCDP